MQQLVEFWRKYRELIEFVGLVIVWPALVYGLVCLISEDSYRERPGMAAMTLAIIGLIAWVAIKVRRGG